MGMGKPGQTNRWGKNRRSKLRGVNVQEVMELRIKLIVSAILLGVLFSISSIFVGYSRNLWLNTSVAFSARLMTL